MALGSVNYTPKKALYPEDVSNDNLLINPDMQINQDGQAVYTSVGYTADMWHMTEGTSTEIVDTDYGKGLCVTASSGSRALLIQPFEETILQNLKDKTVTLSFYAKASEENAHTDIYIGQHGFNINIGTKFQKHTLTCSYNYKTDTFLFRGIGFFCAKNITIVCPKLEIGSIATSFIPPNPATELVKCQRYYEKFNITSGNSLLRFTNKTNANLRMCDLGGPIFFNVPKRTIPTVTMTYDINDSDSIITTPTMCSIDNFNDNLIDININDYLDITEWKADARIYP